MSERGRAYSALTASTLAFTVCFAVWMMNGVLITWLVANGVFEFDRSEMGWLIGIPVLTGALLRLPAGILADRYGGRPVFAGIMMLTAIAAFADSYANGFYGFLLGGLGFGLAGTTFSVGIAYCSVWFPKKQQGTALGIFGAGNAGAAFTAIVAPTLLNHWTGDGVTSDGWRMLPRFYAGALVVTTGLFWLATSNKKPEHGQDRSLVERLRPLQDVRVWRFGLYYFLVFGGFVALAQWLIPYYVNVYSVSVATAGFLTSIFSFPSGVIRALGGWWSDKYGARRVMYWVLGGVALASALLIVPRMDVRSPGEGVLADRAGTVTFVSPTAIQVGTTTYVVVPSPGGPERDGQLVWPTFSFGQEPVVAVGDEVTRKQLLASGKTHIHFQANIWIFTVLVFIVGILMGIGKGAVYKHIPVYYPDDVGAVGGIVGVVGGLGGFVCPIVFGNLLESTGIWTTTWVFFFLLSTVCLIWMHQVIRRVTLQHSPDLAHQFEEAPSASTSASAANPLRAVGSGGGLVERSGP